MSEFWWGMIFGGIIWGVLSIAVSLIIYRLLKQQELDRLHRKLFLRTFNNIGKPKQPKPPRSTVTFNLFEEMQPFRSHLGGRDRKCWEAMQEALLCPTDKNCWAAVDLGGDPDTRNIRRRLKYHIITRWLPLDFLARGFGFVVRNITRARCMAYIDTLERCKAGGCPIVKNYNLNREAYDMALFGGTYKKNLAALRKSNNVR